MSDRTSMRAPEMSCVCFGPFRSPPSSQMSSLTAFWGPFPPSLSLSSKPSGVIKTPLNILYRSSLDPVKVWRSGETLMDGCGPLRVHTLSPHPFLLLTHSPDLPPILLLSHPLLPSHPPIEVSY
ncbi:hypothetical protein BXZ70DRAFT_1077505 [Cristinia sonorae]|uniref:Uncharacterized protein n=1 Tax=Cristinia sonorae TaxID=1940300 RepID=A0A8K0UQ42_9AGAR|nr:hypothetical protein BXZ70DRAFT_1077505 [Cristinia sonorae]